MIHRLRLDSALIAQLGGYLNRTFDGEPGSTALWLGLQKLRHYIKAETIVDGVR